MRTVIQRSLTKLRPPEKISSLEWGLKYRWMSEEQTKLAGKYSDKLTPWAKFILAAMDDPKVRRVVVVKSAQIGWTDGIWNTYLGRIIHTAPCNIFMLFAKRDSYDKYIDKKFNPSVRATPVLRDLINVDAVRSHGSRSGFRKFPGGSITLAGSNSPSNIKSDTINIGCVEEPDDCASNVRGQGDSVFMLGERLKLDPDSKLIFGGTPTIKNLSRVETAYKETDQRKLYVPCHECGEGHVLSWDNVCWSEDPERHDDIYGSALPETAAYSCPHCGSLWDDRQKGVNVLNLYEVIDKPEITDDVGFYINELYSLFSGSELSTLVKKYLKAQYKLEAGDDSQMIGFVNNTLALGYEYQDDNATADELRAKAEDYPELVVPKQAAIITMGVDIQRDRIAVSLYAWGQGGERWLIYFGEIWAAHNINDINDPVWTELDRLLFGVYQHETGAYISVTACSLDTSDGVTQAATYHYIRTRRNKGVNLMAIKGANSIDAPAVTVPRKHDINSTKTKADKYGLQIWNVGTQAIKDNLAAHLKLQGTGPNRIHIYSDVRSDWYDQMTGEVKAPSRTARNKKVWQQKSGQAVEAWDCTVYATHAGMVEKLHTRTAEWWAKREAALIQPDLLGGNEKPDNLVQSIEHRPEAEEAETPVSKSETVAVTPKNTARVTTTKQPTSSAYTMAELAKRMGNH